ncbi:hypothetical protein MNV49_001086 [Pseudohyphozyma bogoriensis]|nr:hypothetical protein MNV49_001086 [Pseudohyphozyma bogoriensis]
MNPYPTFSSMLPAPPIQPPPTHQHSAHQLDPAIFAGHVPHPSTVSPFEPQAPSMGGKARQVKTSQGAFRNVQSERPKSKHSSCSNCRRHKVRFV